MNMTLTAARIFGILFLLFLAGCSHTHQFDQNPNIGTMERTKLSGKTLAADLSGVPEEYHDRANGHKFNITGIRSNADIVVHKWFAKEQWVNDPAKAEYLLKLKVELQLGSAFMGTHCTANAQWDIVRQNKIVSTGKGSDDASIPTVQAGGSNCEIAYLKAISTAMDDALGKM